MAKLYQFPEKYRLWMDAVEANDGELNSELLKELQEIDASLETKVDAYAAMIRQFQYEEEMFKEESQRLAAKAHAAGGRVERMKATMMQVMQAMQATKLKGRKFIASICKSPNPRVSWVSQEDIPEAFRRVTVDLDKPAAQRYLKEFGCLPEGFTATQTEYIKIY